jgi:hypothetical protein
LVITALLIYTAIYVPYNTAFIDNSTIGIIVFETLVDAIFITDMIL